MSFVLLTCNGVACANVKYLLIIYDLLLLIKVLSPVVGWSNHNIVGDNCHSFLLYTMCLTSHVVFIFLVYTIYYTNIKENVCIISDRIISVTNIDKNT